MKKTPRVEFIVVGDELLSGRVVDTNSSFLGRELSVLGLPPARVQRVGDDESAITSALADAAKSAGLVFVIGGLGPTTDDKTVASVASFNRRPLVVNRPTLDRVRRHFRTRRRAMPTAAARQALVPAGARMIRNPIGMAPGTIIEGVTTFVLLPGVPEEMRAMWETGLRGLLLRRFGLPRPHNRVLRTFGITESEIADHAAPVLRLFPEVTAAYYPSTTGVDLLLRSAREYACRRCADALVQVLGSHVYEVGESPLEAVVGRMLRRKKLTLVTAESCTGGLVADRLTNVAGSSDYFLGGVIVYSNRVKSSLLGVRDSTLQHYGAVSRETVSQMAYCARRLLDARVGVAVSGIAGPSGGTRTKPVGLVFVAVSMGARLLVERHEFSGDRRMVKERSASAALDLCRRLLEGWV